MQLHPDRLLPAEPGVRGIAREILAQTQGLPIVSPHGHVDPRLLLDDAPFPDPATLFVRPDHYVTRLLHASGVGLDQLLHGEPREVWRLLCAHWPVYRGTPVRWWLEAELAGIFGIDEPLSDATADAVYDRLADCLARPEFRPRALFERFGISVLATTDDPCDDLGVHAALAADPAFAGRVVPTFRPDRYLEAGRADWPVLLEKLAGVSGVETGSYEGFVAALEQRRRHFVEHGATSADHSHADVGIEPLAPADAARIHREALRGRATGSETVAYRRHLLLEMARMSCDDGLVMTLHPGVLRGHHGPTVARFGPDTGSDLPVRVEFTAALRPLLERFGTAAGFHLVLFTLDETTWSREIAPLAGFYPSVYAGVPWWFLDAPAAMRRFREAVTETAGFARTSGFVDDTRAFCSIPARHDLARRVDAGYLAGLVAEHQLELDEAVETAVQLIVEQPTHVFKL